jgi:hypothetical protein
MPSTIGEGLQASVVQMDLVAHNHSCPRRVSADEAREHFERFDWRRVMGRATWVDMPVIHPLAVAVGDDGAAGVIGGSHVVPVPAARVR